MKKIILLLLVVYTPLNYLHAQNSNNKVIITGTRFTYPIIEKWIFEFKKSYPNVNVYLAPLGSQASDSANLKITSHDIGKSDLKDEDNYVAVAKYGLMSIANTKSPLVPYYKNKGLQEKDINELFFTDNSDKNKNYVVYTREKKSCAPISFAAYYGHSFSDLSGIKVPGDDKDLLAALKKDSLGISYNNLGYVYNTRTRKLVEGIAVLPVDLNQNGKIDPDENFYATLDEVIKKYENTQSKLLATEDVNIIYSKVSPTPNIAVFLNWVLNEGQKYNHEVGFLNFNTGELDRQKIALKNNVQN
jgi:phosphate transport system substrate-binding protein